MLCKKCGLEKHVNSFYKNPYLNCKKCHDAKSVAWRKGNLDKFKGYCRVWYNNMSKDPVKYEQYKAKKREAYAKRKLISLTYVGLKQS